MNILGYVRNFGNKTFKEFAFNDVDALILAELAYINFDQCVSGKHFIKFKDLEIEEPKSFYYGSVDSKDNQKLFELMMESKRFKNIKVGNCKGSVDENIKEQFFAVTFLLPNETAYIAFRGTDTSILGWKEDLLLAYKDGIPGQLSAVEYLNDAVTHFDCNFYVGGHSKGGNLSIYSSLHMHHELHDRLIKTYSFDGPGFRKDIKKLPLYKYIENKIVKYLTSNDVIGVIYNEIPDAKIVFSRGVFIFGHDPFNWEIKRMTGSFSYTQDRGRTSKLNERALMSWLTEMDDSDKKMAVDVIEKLVGDSQTIYDLLLKGGRLLMDSKKRMEEYSEEDRERTKVIFKRLGKYFLSTYDPRKYLIRKNKKNL